MKYLAMRSVLRLVKFGKHMIKVEISLLVIVTVIVIMWQLKAF